MAAVAGTFCFKKIHMAEVVQCGQMNELIQREVDNSIPQSVIAINRFKRV